MQRCFKPLLCRDFFCVIITVAKMAYLLIEGAGMCFRYVGKKLDIIYVGRHFFTASIYGAKGKQTCQVHE